jgi:chemotaxis regulatin CheY-phosphate phosphatase CheZ
MTVVHLFLETIKEHYLKLKQAFTNIFSLHEYNKTDRTEQVIVTIVQILTEIFQQLIFSLYVKIISFSTLIL